MCAPKSIYPGFLLSAALLASLTGAAQNVPVKPENVGMSASRLQRVDAFMARLQAEGKLAGGVTVVARRGQLVSLEAHGFADLEARRPARTDDIFQIQSMTKPVATVVALMLLEEGRFLLSDPVARFLPEFREMKVAVPRADAPDGFVLVPADRPMTIYDLLTHRAGFTGLPPTDTPAERLRRKAVQSLPPEAELTLEAYIRNLAASPLEAQPGARFKYGPSTIVLGRLIEAVSGQPLDAVFRDKVFRPLGMIDSFFVVPEEKRSRVAPAYSWSPATGLVKLPPDPLSTRFFSAGGNLFSTAADYLRFCQMLLNGGKLNGHRYLSEKAMTYLMTPQTGTLPTGFFQGGATGNHGTNYGWGIATSILRTPHDGAAAMLSPGTFGHGGAWGTQAWVDPVKGVAYVLMVQRSNFANSDASEVRRAFQDAAAKAIKK